MLEIKSKSCQYRTYDYDYFYDDMEYIIQGLIFSQ